MLNRRDLIKAGAMAAGAAMVMRPRRAQAFAQSLNLKKFIQPMRGVGGTGIPIAAKDTKVRPWWQPGVDHYTIDINQFTDVLHPELYPTGSLGTKLWGYGQNNNFKHLGGIIAVHRGTPVQITFRNNLPLPHIIPVDTTLPSFEGGMNNRVATHLHGGLVPWISDGGPFDWWDPNGNRGPSFLNNEALNRHAAVNEAEYYYPNDQGSRLLWYHDHAHSLTRINAYAGIASGYVIYDDYELSLVSTGNLPGPLDPRTHYLIFQDKIFVQPNIAAVDPTWPLIMPGSDVGDLWYAHVYDTGRYDKLGPHPAGLPPDPSCVPEYFGDTMLVNGTVFPTLDVEQREYRFRILNACNARFLNPRLVYAQGTTFPASAEPAPNVAGPPFVQVASEGGFLPAPVMLNGQGQPRLLVAPAERADLIVDFRNVPAGSILILYSDAQAPYPRGDSRNDYYPGNPKTPTSIPGYGPNTRTLLQIRVNARVGPLDPPITLPAAFTPTDPFMVAQTPGVPIVPVVNDGTTSVTLADGTTVEANFRQLTLNETFDDRGRLIQYLGTNQPPNPLAPNAFGREYLAAPTEIVPNGAYEVWELANLTGDVHPIHFHLVNVQILSRQAFSVSQYNGVPNFQGPPVAPDANELGWKETVRMNPGEVTRVFAKFDLPAVPFAVPASPRMASLGIPNAHEYVYHCHILEHEEHDMMRPLVIV